MTRASISPRWADADGDAGTTRAVQIAGLTAQLGELEPGEAPIDRIFATVRAALDAAQMPFADVDNVLLAADDLADGRSITTMINATAAGSYRKDEMRTTQGSLTALGLAGLRVSSGMSERSIVASWWQPTADLSEIARSGLDPRDGVRLLLPPERLVDGTPQGGCVACVVQPAVGDGGLELEGFSWGQAHYDQWIAGVDEPEGVLRRLGTDLRARCAIPASGVLATSAPADGAWSPAIEAAGLGDGWRTPPRSDAHYGIADGLVALSELAPGLRGGDAGIVMATGVPRFALVEAAMVRHVDA